MVPPNFAPYPNFTSARMASLNQAAALAAAGAPKVVALSSIGGERESGFGFEKPIGLMRGQLVETATRF